ncbi:MAG: phospho-N-acetylmuramoyl-pentapeptide-transferase [Clostridia bacterium]|nr:phospho-N-acetylmuramoyl-pentapeptide-transferase [Clostridia bacterium]
MLSVFVLTAAASVLVGTIAIPVLTRLKFAQYVRDDGPARHFKKAGTPTMGGIIFLIPLVLITFFFVGYSTQVATAAVVTLGYGIIGFVDDFIKIALKRPLGLRARYKLVGQVILAFLLGLFTIFYLNNGTDIYIPFIDYNLDMGYLYFPFILLVLVGSTNAVNITDGLDGLAAGTTIFTAVGFAFVSLLLDKPDLAVFATSLAGGCLGFLVFNFHPAKVFMGDTGSLALGGGLASIAVLTGTELLLLIIGGIYVIETLSVIIQVISFRLTGRRVFLMSPLHHHFELKGWEEEHIVIYFWFASAVFSVLGVLALFYFI